MKEQIGPLTRAFVDGLRRILGDKLHGCYIYGAAAFPDNMPTGDIDFHVILEEPPTDDEKSALSGLHKALGRDYPPLGKEMDGYYLLLADARGSKPPQSQMWNNATDTSWALHRAHLRAGRFLALHGPDPKEIYATPTWPEIEHALEGELTYVEDHLGQYPPYCILQLCRLIYSHQTREVVVSKAQTSRWARDEFPEWKRLIELAGSAYAGEASQEDNDVMRSEVSAFLQFARAKIARAAGDRRGT